MRTYRQRNKGQIKHRSKRISKRNTGKIHVPMRSTGRKYRPKKKGTEQERQALLQKRELRRKRCIRRLSLGLFLLLVFCTFASAEVEKMRFPQVTTGMAEAGIIRQDGREVEYEYTVPLSALFTGELGYQVFAVFPQHTRFGISYSVVGLPTEVLAMDEERAALDSGMGVELVLSSDRPLVSEMEVMVTNEREAG